MYIQNLSIPFVSINLYSLSMQLFLMVCMLPTFAVTTTNVSLCANWSQSVFVPTVSPSAAISYIPDTSFSTFGFVAWVCLDVELKCIGHGDSSEDDGAGKLAGGQLHLVVSAPA